LNQAEIEPVPRAAWEIRKAKELQTWTAFHTDSLPGEALPARMDYARAAPLLRDGYRGMKQRLDNIPPRDKPRLAEALDRFITLATETGKPNEAKSWRDEKARLSGPASSKPGAGRP
jgi:hypothetical protein